MSTRKSAFAIPGVVATIFAGLFILLAPAAHAQDKPKVYLSGPKALETSFQGEDALVRALNTGKGTPLSLAADDFDGDGMTDLAAGYATPDGGRIVIFRGNLDAFAPQSRQSFDAIGRGNFPQPFLTGAQVLEVPGQPDFLAAGMFIGHDGPALIAAARGGHQIYVFVQGDSGKLELLQTVDVPGSISALDTYNTRSGAYMHAVVGVHGVSGPALLLYAGSNEGLTPGVSLPLSGDATAFAFGNLDGDGTPDVLVLAGGQISILHGATLSLEPVSVPFKVVKTALGTFVSDRDPLLQMALLGDDGGVHIFARDTIDSRPFTLEEMQARRREHITRSLDRTAAAAAPAAANEPAPEPRAIVWKEVEFFAGAGAADADGIAPQFFRTRIADNPADDIMALGAGRMSVIAHPGQNPTTGQVISRLEDANSVSAAMPLRVNIDGRPGVVFMKQGGIVPFVMMPLPDPTFFPNRFDDPIPGAIASTCNNVSNGDTSTSCSLREAIRKANAAAGTDTIMLAAGTYTLALARNAGDHSSSLQGTLEVQDSLNLIGAGQNSTIIQAGTNAGNTGSPNGVDMVIAFNEDIDSTTNATVSVSNLTIQNGFNRGNTSIQDGDGGGFEFDTGTGTANLTMTNVTVTNNGLNDGRGGGGALFNTLNGTGTPTFTNCIIQNNDAHRNPAAGVMDPNGAGDGGGLFIAFPSKATMNTTQVLNNTATQVQGTGRGQGGGIWKTGGGNLNLPLTIHGGAISGNQSSGDGGGLYATSALSIDQGTVFNGNTAGGSGGGIWVNSGNAGESATLTKVTITGNNASGAAGGGSGFGGGIFIGAAGRPATISFSRFAGNLSQVAGANNLANQAAGPGSAVTATNNWWGTNAASSTISPSTPTCPTPGAQQVCFDPFIVLTHMGSPQKIKINQSSGLTADMSKDNHGNGAALAGNLSQIIGLPITFNNPILGSISGAQTNLNASAMATATFNAGPTAGRGSANATVDQAVVPVNSNLIASAIEAGTTVTITTVGAHGYSTNEYVSISGVGVAGYNGNYFKITSTPTVTTFTYTAGSSGLASSSGGTANAGIIILQPPTMTKSFSPTVVATNTASTLTFSITNGNVIPINGSFTDTFPVGVVVATTPTVVNNCGGTFTANAGAGSVTYSNDPATQSGQPTGTCTISVNVQSAVDNVYNNSVTLNSSDAGNAAAAATATLTVINPPTVLKTFGAASIPLNSTTTLSIKVSSTNANLTLNGVSFTDTLPAGVIVATPGNLSNGCTGSASGADGAGVVSLSGASLAPGANCTVTVTVKGSTAGVKNNSVTASDTVAGSGNTSNATLDVVAPPTISKAFSPTSVALNANSTVTFTIVNPNTFSTLSGVGFSDSLPAGIVVAASPNIVNTCGGTPVAGAGTGTISLSGGTLTASPAAGSTCTLSVSVTGTIAGAQSNTTGAVTSTEGGTGNTSNTAVLSVLAPPSIAKVFNPNSIALNGTTSLQFTITNPAANTAALTGVAFSDTLPTGLTVANASATVCGGTLTTTNPTTISLSGATIAVNSQCVFSVTVTGATSGSYTNTTGTVSSTNGGTGNTATANLSVVAPPSITKSFGNASIPANSSTTLSFTITNPNTFSALSGVAFTDTLPAGLVVAATPNITGSCGSGTITANAGAGSVSLSGGTLTASPSAGASCTFSVSVTGTTGGVKNNSVQVTSTEGGTGNTSNASVTVVGPPTISKSFTPTSVALNANSTLSFTISNPNTASGLSGVGFNDTLPSGVVVAASPTITGSCGSGTITAVAGTSTVSLSGGTLTASPAAGSSCTFSVSVTGTTAGAKSNTTGAVTSTEGGTGNTSNTAVLTVVAPPSIAKLFNPATISLNGTTSLQFTITNPAANTISLTGVAFSDTLPTGLTVATSSATVCGGTLTTTNPTTISLAGATIAANSQCQFNVTVTGAASGNYTNTTGTVSSTNGGTGNAATANLTVAAAPQITKSFNPTSIPVNTSSTLSFTIANPNTNVTLNGVAFTDTLPAGLVVAATPNVTGSCGGGSITANAGAGSVSLSGASLASSTNCMFSVAVTGTTSGVKNNSVQVTSTEGGTGNTSNASLTVVGPPTVSKSFSPTTVALNASSTLSFTVTNTNTASGQSGVAFTDNLPSGVVVSASPSITGSCGSGTITAVAGTSTVSLSGGTLTASPAAGSSCTFSVSVTGTTAGAKSNTTAAVSSTEGGTGATSNTAVLTVVAPPSLAKLFNPATISLNGTTSLQFTITNPAANTVSLTGVAFSDTLPSGLTVATSSATVCGGTLTTTNPTTISLAGATIAANSQCQFNVTVTGAASGNYMNTTGTVSATNGGTGNAATANLTVAAAPQITKSFNPTQIAVGASSTLSFTIANPNTNVTLNGVAFTDTLPAGLVVAATPNVTGSCGGGSITANAGAGSVSLSGATLASSTNCMFSVAVTGTTGGVKNNAVQVTSTEGGTGNTSNASVTVVGPPTVSKAFSVASIPLNGVATITFTVMNTSATAGATGISFNDTLPAGLVVANPANASAGTCTGTFAPNPGDTSLSISGIALSAGNACTVKVDVKGIAAGDQPNSTGPVSSMEGGTGPGSNTATITVVAPPTLAKAFGAGSIALNATTTLTFTIMNPAANTGSQTGIAFTDTLPSGLIVVNPPDPNTGNTCNGTVTAANGGNSISFANGTIAVNTNCTFAVTVQGTTEGSKLNTTGTISSTEGGTGSVATASMTVGAPATISKAFGAAQITVNNNTSLTFTLNNPNTVVDLTGVAFSDALPAGLVVASSPNVVNGCNGVVTASGGSGSISLSGGTLAHGTMCTISLNVTGTTAGVKNNVTGNISSNEGGTGGPSNTATVTVVGPPIITKSFLASSLPLNGSTTITFSISNPNSTVGLTGVNFSDTLISGLVVAATPNVVNTCNGTPSATGSSIGLSAGTIAAGGSCTLKVDVTGTSGGDKPNTTSAIGSTEGGTGFTSNTATVNIVAPPTLGKAFGVANIPLNGTTSLTFTVTNPAANTVSQSGVAFTDTLPAGLLVATPNGLSPGCGTVTATAGGNSITLSGGSVGINTNCTFSVNVTGTSEGSKLNTTGTISSTNGGTGTVATATVTVAAPPTIAKAFGVASIPQGANTSLTFTITNPNTVVTLNGIAFTDTLPAGIVVATPSNLTNNCGGSPTASGGTVSLTGGTRAPGASCTVSVTVTGTTSGVKNNSVSVTSTEGGTGNTSNASITVVGPPTIAKAFGIGAIPLNGQTTLTFTLTNTSATINQTGLAFSDTLPAGLVVGTPGSVSNTCNGTLTAVTGAGTVSLAAGTLNAAQQCTIVVNVQGVTPGAKVNTSGVVSSNEGGTGSASNTATLNVDGPPSIAKAFGAPNIALNATTSLTFTITNPAANADPQNGVTFTDTLPAGLVVATPNGLTGQCNGAVTATAGSGVITLAGGSIPVNSNCSFSVNVTGTTSGIKNNTTSTVSSTNGGSGNAATATISVALPPTISKAFGAASIPLSGSTSLTFTLANPNSSQSLSGVQFTDSLPAGLMVASPTGASNTCNGTFAPGAGNTTLTFTGGVIPSNGTCSIAVNVAASSQGVKINTTGAISSNESGAGATSNTATLNVVAPPTISKSFSPSTIDLFGTTTLTFTIGNPGGNPVAENGVTFSDTLPAGLVVASTPNVVNNCGGSVTAAAGSGSISLANGTTSNTCTIAVNVTANSGGVKNNVSGNVSSTNGGTGNTAAASVTVRVADLVISKSHTDPFAAGSPLGTYTLTVSNIGPVASFGPVTVTDQLPNGLTPTTLQGTGWNCNLLTLTCSRSDALAPGASYPAITLTVSVSPTTAISVTNNATVSGGAEVNTSNDTAMDVTNVTCAYSFAPPSAFFSGAGGNGSFLVITGPGCPIAPVNNASFVSNVTVSGNTVNFSVAQNILFTGRSGSITVGGQAFTVQQAGVNPLLTIVPQKLVFLGDTVTTPPSQTVSISGNDGAFFDVTVDVPWAKVSRDSTQLPATLTVSVSPAGLKPGNYTGTITVNVGGTSTTIFIQYTVFGLSLIPSPTQLTFTYVIGGPLPASQQLTIFAQNTIAITAAPGGAGFVSVSPSSGTTPQVFTVSVDPSNLGVGSYPASVVISGNGVSNSPLVVPITLIVSATGPQFTAAGVVNAASFLAEPLAPGSLFTIFGVNLANNTLLAPGPGLPTSLGGVSMTIGGIPVPLQFISPGQVNAQVPFELGLGQQQLVYTNNGVTITITVTIVPAEPGVFIVNGRGAILNQNNTLNTPLNPAVVGSAVQVFFTGQGLVTPPLATGAPASLTTLMFTKATTTATIGGAPATVIFSGLAPGFVGLGQANVLVPSLATNDYTLILTVNGQDSNGVKVAVKTP